MARQTDPRLKGIAEQVRRTSKKDADKEPDLTYDKDKLVPTGCGMLDVMASETMHGGWHLGTMVNVIGDITTGKSILAISSLAECALLPRFNNHRLIYDDTENADNLRNMSALFNDKVLRRIGPPRPNTETPNSDTVEALQANFYAALKEGPCIYVVDSLDGLSAKAEIKRVKKAARDHLVGKDPEKGSFKTEKPRVFGEMLRVFYGELQKTDSLLMIISQVRENLDSGPFTPKHRRNGGKALDHHCQHILWMMRGKLQARHKREVRGKDRVIGNPVVARMAKNRLTGHYPRIVSFDIFPSYGVDSLGSMVDWMIEEEFWQQRKQTIVAEGIGFEGSRAKLLQHIEDGGYERKLRRQVYRGWKEIENAMRLKRKRRF